MFYWGTATAAPQIEGAAHSDGKTDSIWDVFARIPGKILGNDTPERACDHYNRWEDDVTLLQDLGVNAYRFSIAWPRIMPAFSGPVNQKGLDFYKRLVDRLLENHIEPFVTLHHWDLPQYLQERGGWALRETVSVFCDYTETVVKELGDRVRYWVPINEPSVIANLGHAVGIFAPGIRDYQAYLAVTHHLNLAHAAATQRIKAILPQSQVGTAVTLFTVSPKTSADAAAAIKMSDAWGDNFLRPFYTGDYPESIAQDLQKYIYAGDSEALRQKPDFIGVNHYTPHIAWEDAASVVGESIMAAHDDLSENNTDFGWKICPDDFYQTLQRLKKNYDNPVIMVTENGCAYNDAPDEQGRIRDTRRIAYLERYLSSLQKARQDGCNISGYFLWSFMDNFEWASGYGQRFGITYVEYESMKRKKKDSFEWYKNYIQSHIAE